MCMYIVASVYFPSVLLWPVGAQYWPPRLLWEEWKSAFCRPPEQHYVILALVTFAITWDNVNSDFLAMGIHQLCILHIIYVDH